jgi:hypothetical protein
VTALLTSASIDPNRLGKGSARHVVVKYGSAGGYTPGDTLELFVGSDNRVEELLFRH